MDQAWKDAVNALLRAIGDAAQDAESLRNLANSDWTRAAQLEERIAIFTLAAARVRNRFVDLENIEA